MCVCVGNVYFTWYIIICFDHCREGGNLFFKLLGFTLIGTGGIIGYAWYDEKFRSTVEQRLPYSEKTFKYIFQYLPSSRESTPERYDFIIWRYNCRTLMFLYSLVYVTLQTK